MLRMSSSNRSLILDISRHPEILSWIAKFFTVTGHQCYNGPGAGASVLYFEEEPKWRNGRRAGLKNRWDNIPCQFESDLRHQMLYFILKAAPKRAVFVDLSTKFTGSDTRPHQTVRFSSAPLAFGFITGAFVCRPGVCFWTPPIIDPWLIGRSGFQTVNCVASPCLPDLTQPPICGDEPTPACS